MNFSEVPERISFPEQEEKTLEFWKEIDAFQTSLKQSEGRPRYTFYDGPPFATGLPHYGHLLAGTIKDIVTRYWHEQGFYVERRFGWDCHGLPVEFEIDKKLGITSKEDVLAMGIDKYNAECRSIVMRYSKEWETTVTRIGRWIDFENDYKTLNPSFMESVWWVFGQLFKKDLVYRGYKVMPYSMACHTPLSNFEANQNYKDVSDPAVVVSFKLVDDEATSILAWTTTPWTLPSNMALCVNATFEYIKVKDIASGNFYILMEKRLSSVYKVTEPGKEFEVVERFPGSSLVGKRYVPLFNYFYELKKNEAFRVLADNYVTDDSGTGIVHQAPAFGEDDYRVCLQNGVIAKGEVPILPLDEVGRFTSEVTDFAGKNVKDADKDIIKHLKAAGRLVNSGTIVHSYPFCWRSDTPLIYRAIPSWFVKVESLVDKLLVNNAQSRWVPEFVQEKRFANWLKDARDWSISRNRYWGTPIPLWVSDDGEEVIAISSMEELKELSGVTITDMHRESIDHITIPSRTGRGVLRRVEEVFDCWFESGSMPYAQQHYPFENVEKFNESFPADFIAEGLDQTRGWFYTLLVISTALFDKAPFKNLVVNGLVLAADGKKMSKRLKNYPDPLDILNAHGADALRLYLINSPVVRAETLRFKEDGVRNIVKDLFLPWFNAYRFFVQNAQRLELESSVKFTYDPTQLIKSDNVMDHWILAATHSLIKFVMEEMAAYRLYTVVPRLVKLIDDLTNWYVRLNRRRLKGENGVTNCLASLQTLFEVLMLLTRMMSPFTPFLTEYFWQNLRRAMPGGSDDANADASKQDTRSVHFMMFPQPTQSYFDTDIVRATSVMQRVIELGRVIRERKNVSLKTPVREVIVLTSDQQALDDASGLRSYILEELNARQLTCTLDRAAYGVEFKADPNFKALGKRLGPDLQKVTAAIRGMSLDAINEYRETSTVTLCGHTLAQDDIVIVMQAGSGAATGASKRVLELNQSGNLLVLLDMTPDDSLAEEGLAREIVNRVQRLRKKAELKATDDVAMCFEMRADPGQQLASALATQADVIVRACRGVPVPADAEGAPKGKIIIEEEQEIKGSKFLLRLVEKTA